LKKLIQVSIAAGLVLSGQAFAECSYTENGTYLCINGSYYHGTTPDGQKFSGYRDGSFNTGELGEQVYGGYSWGGKDGSSFDFEGGQRADCWGSATCK